MYNFGRMGDWHAIRNLGGIKSTQVGRSYHHIINNKANHEILRPFMVRGFGRSFRELESSEIK